jgi:hypothetical protein
LPNQRSTAQLLGSVNARKPLTTITNKIIIVAD